MEKDETDDAGDAEQQEKDDTDDAADGDEDTEQAKEQYGLEKCKDANGRCCRRSLRNKGIVKKYM